jgi:hypothetical protein
MITLRTLLDELDEVNLAQVIGIPHDQARLNYRPPAATVRDWDEFMRLITDYYNYHYSTCNTGGGRLRPEEARGRAKRLLEQEYRRRRGDIRMAFAAARDGVDGGVRGILDALTEGIKAESMEFYIQDRIDEFAPEGDYNRRSHAAAEVLNAFAHILPRSTQARNPHRYANDLPSLIRAYVDGLRQSSSLFRSI